jgi:predicted nuclease with TOPRIM domain
MNLLNIFSSFSLDLAIRDNDIQKLNGLNNELNAEISRIKELLQRQSVENDQLKKANEQHQNNHAEENNKIEIRNLQNALDSSKKELEAHKVLVSDLKLKVDELNKQLVESKQLTQQKPANDSFLVSTLFS